MVLLDKRYTVQKRKGIRPQPFVFPMHFIILIKNIFAVPLFSKIFSWYRPGVFTRGILTLGFFIIFSIPLHAKKFSISNKTVGRIYFYGCAADKSSYKIRKNGKYYFNLNNSEICEWGSVGIDLKQPYDLKEFTTITFRVKGRHGGEKFQVILRDMDWTNFNLPESNSPPIPEEGLDTKWSTISFNLSELEGDVDLGYLVHIAIEFGSVTTGNMPDAGIFLKDIIFTAPEAQPQHISVASASRTNPDVPEPEYYGPPLPPFEPVKNNNQLNMLTMLGMGCAILLGGILYKKRMNGHNGNGFKPWLLSTNKPNEFPIIPAPEGKIGILYEINTRAWGAKRLKNDTIRLRCFDQISGTELKQIRAVGFDTIWMMGIWEISNISKEISRMYADDFEGSPYAIPEYKVNHELGGEEQFVDFVNRAHKLGLKIIVDFVPNHMALDSRWINEHPEFFISFPLNHDDAQLSENELLYKFPGFYPTCSESFPEGGKRLRKRIMVAYGKDPNFFPWIDTAQLDYTNPRLRMVLINLLKYWAKIVDGVRCDTVMLVLREQIKHQWHYHIPWEYYDRLFPEEFWLEAINEVKQINPDFTFIAETYWNKEEYLQSIGFDLTYNKTVYDLLRIVINGDDPWKFQQYIRSLPADFLSKSLYFIENHDEERAMSVFGEEGQKAASVCIGCLPGAPLIHQGQMEGFSDRLPVHRIIPLHEEKINHRLKEFYKKLLPICAHPVFRQGNFYVLNSSNNNIFSFFRRLKDEVFIIAINLTNSRQNAIFYLPKKELALDRKLNYAFRDYYYDLKTKENRTYPNVKPVYKYKGTHLIAKGLFIDLGPYDSHIFKLI